MTIHNAAYQGWFPPATTERLLFPWAIFTMDRVEQFDNFNFLKGGLVYSDMLTTVSRKYAEEIQTAEFGEKLEGVLRGRAADLRGILNGVDYAQWDPATDGKLAAHYSAGDLAASSVPRRSAGCVRTGEGGCRDADDWDRFAVGDAEGLRLCGGDCRPAYGPECGCSGPWNGRAGL